MGFSRFSITCCACCPPTRVNLQEHGGRVFNPSSCVAPSDLHCPIATVHQTLLCTNAGRLVACGWPVGASSETSTGARQTVAVRTDPHPSPTRLMPAREGVIQDELYICHCSPSEATDRTTPPPTPSCFVPGWSYHSSQADYADTGIAGTPKNKGILAHRSRGRVWFRVAATPEVAREVEVKKEHDFFCGSFFGIRFCMFGRYVV